MTQMAGQRPIDRLLAEYGESHRDPVNVGIHMVAVPAIFWSVIAMLWELPVPAGLQASRWLNWATLFALLASVYYVLLSTRLAAVMIVFIAVCLILAASWPASLGSLWRVALVVFTVAWVAQFLGHRMEGRRPSFFKDAQFLLIGPAWVMLYLARRLGIAY